MSTTDRYVPIALAAVAFVATVAISWHHQTASGPREFPPPTQQRSQRSAGAPELRAQTFPQASPRESQLLRSQLFTPTRGAAPDAVVPANVSDTPSDQPDSDAEVPVSISFRHAPGRPGVEAGVADLSGHALEVTASLLDPRTGQEQQLQFTAVPGAGRVLGVADGWDLQSGDQITVRSPPFHDRVFQVP
jgi:hypothetical protein